MKKSDNGSFGASFIPDPNHHEIIRCFAESIAQ